MASTFSDVIDEIWRSAQPRHDVALKQMASMSESDILGVVSIDVCSKYSVLPLNSKYDPSNESKIFQLALPQSVWHVRLAGEHSLKKAAIFKYADLDAIFTVTAIEGEAPKPLRFENDLSNILSALQVARDHVDSLLYLPYESRNNRLQDFASEFHMPLDQFRFLASNYKMLVTALV